MFQLRDFCDNDASKINELALVAFEQYKNHYSDWSSFSRALNKFSDLSATAEIMVAIDSDNKIMGAVAYVPPMVKKADYFPLNTPIIRMLVVNPNARGQGIGKALSLACINKAARDACKSIALHTSSIMDVALPMYLNMGFVLHAKAPDIFGVTYNVYTKEIATQ